MKTAEITFKNGQVIKFPVLEMEYTRGIPGVTSPRLTYVLPANTWDRPIYFDLDDVTSVMVTGVDDESG